EAVLAREASGPSHEGRNGEGVAAPQSLTIGELRHLWEIGAPLIILDVRTDRTYDPSPTRARGATRLPPDHVAERATELHLPREVWLVAYCA
ncbi:MAG TPA: hypothetical protein VHN13_07070, partial [Candidatus Tectomicrobia bacterium]|nr:hypothetical protein [Candidatus Tectomicrobia bacterium]